MKTTPDSDIPPTRKRCAKILWYILVTCMVSVATVLIYHTATREKDTGPPLMSRIGSGEALLRGGGKPGKFQFAIISDLWGGYRFGIFEDAVQKLELLQPEFVISVGDLIDGNLYDTAQIHQQWDAFYSMLEPLSVPFYPVPGNHDISNPVMERIWETRCGRTYYAFTYRGVLFLSVNTQDGGSSGIGEEQISYFREAIEKSGEVEWTFVFMHRPVWMSENGKEEGYEEIESALTGRSYTVFSGHQHTYQLIRKNGNKHFVLGTTGSASDLQGEESGQFDHLTWVVCEPGLPPRIVNLKLDGIIKEDVVDSGTW